MWTPQISLETANQFYTWGWRASLIGALVTAIGVIFLFWGTRVRDRDFETQMGTLNREAGHARERAAQLEEGNLQLGIKLEQERSERLKLEVQISPRVLGPAKNPTISQPTYSIGWN